MDAKDLTSILFQLQLLNGLAFQNKQMLITCCQTLKTLVATYSLTLKCLLVETINSLDVVALLLIRELWVFLLIEFQPFSSHRRAIMLALLLGLLS